ncbi:hypothetical protein [Paraburkholderia fungorum]|uniref:hypothetical protein n=1 Tax=Paraburkholderia fungorum TaxID=134537 RepID=UPI0038BCCA41
MSEVCVPLAASPADVADALIANLYAIVGKKHTLTDEAATRRYSSYATHIRAIALFGLKSRFDSLFDRLGLFPSHFTDQPIERSVVTPLPFCRSMA